MYHPEILLYGFAIFALAAYLPALFFPVKHREALEEIIRNNGEVRELSIFNLVFAILFLSVQSTFDGGWMMIFPIFGYIALLKCIFTLWFPTATREIIHIFLGKKGLTRFMGLVGSAFAVFIGYVAYALI